MVFVSSILGFCGVVVGVVGLAEEAIGWRRSGGSTPLPRSHMWRAGGLGHVEDAGQVNGENLVLLGSDVEELWGWRCRRC